MKTARWAPYARWRICRLRVGSLWWLRVAHLLFRCTRASSFFMRRKVLVVMQQRLNHAALHSASCARACAVSVSVFYDQSTLPLLHNSLYFRVSRDVFGGSLFSCTWTRRFHRDSTCNLFLYLYLLFVRALPCFTVTSLWIIACDRFSDFFVHLLYK